MAYDFAVRFDLDESGKFARAYMNDVYQGRVYFKPNSHNMDKMQLAFRDPTDRSKRFVRNAYQSLYPTISHALTEANILKQLIPIVIRAGINPGNLF